MKVLCIFQNSLSGPDWKHQVGRFGPVGCMFDTPVLRDFLLIQRYVGMTHLTLQVKIALAQVLQSIVVKCINVSMDFDGEDGKHVHYSRAGIFWYLFSAHFTNSTVTTDCVCWGVVWRQSYRSQRLGSEDCVSLCRMSTKPISLSLSWRSWEPAQG